ncbi:MAG TPA: beta-L-arabinofuranosidase domain-containing protein [Opitutaceae bacterium]
MTSRPDTPRFHPRACRALALIALLHAGTSPRTLAAQAEDEARFVASPPTDRRNEHYVSNRAPLSPSPLVPLPLKAIEPRGWLRKQLELQAEGFHGHFGEISRFLQKEKNSWLDPQGEGEHGWEEVPYWLKGYAHLAYLLEDPGLIGEARIWLEGAIASQQPDGWFGPRKAKATVRSTAEDYDLWPNMIMLFCLQSHYDYSGDARVLELMKKYFRWQLAYPALQHPQRQPDGSTAFWQWPQQRAADNLWSVYWLYNRTGEAWLLELAERIHQWGADWTSGLASEHNVNIAEGFDSPAIYWQQSHDPRHLAAAERNWRRVRDDYGQVPGGMFGGDEMIRPGFTGPRQAIETCGIVEEMLSDEQLLQITGDPAWADRTEDVAYNSFPATMTPDMKALRYLTAPNHPQSDSASKAPGIRNGGPMYLLSPSRYRCCQHNFGHGWPYFASSLWFATSDNGLAAVFYNESHVTAKVGARGSEVKISAQTRYPFDEGVRLKISVQEPVRFPLYLRVPGWCQQPAVAVNGQPLRASSLPPSRASGYFVLDRSWSDGEVVELTLPMQLNVRRWEKNHDSVSVDRGPLTFSLKIAERYQRQGGSDTWPSWELWPASPWNYGLVLDAGDPAASFELVRRDWPANNQPFTLEGAPILLKARGRRIPQWQLDERGLVEDVQQSPARTSEPIEPITLIPMGAARLRISAFPVSSDAPEAHAWTPAPTAP